MVTVDERGIVVFTNMGNRVGGSMSSRRRAVKVTMDRITLRVVRVTVDRMLSWKQEWIGSKSCVTTVALKYCI